MTILTLTNPRGSAVAIAICTSTSLNFLPNRSILAKKSEIDKGSPNSSVLVNYNLFIEKIDEAVKSACPPCKSPCINLIVALTNLKISASTQLLGGIKHASRLSLHSKNKCVVKCVIFTHYTRCQVCN